MPMRRDAGAVREGRAVTETAVVSSGRGQAGLAFGAELVEAGEPDGLRITGSDRLAEPGYRVS